MQPVINELIKFAIRQSPHRRIKIESAWEKQHLAWEKKHLTKQEQMDVAERKMQLGECEIPTLRGWFLKEKQETFKRRQSFLPSFCCNRRWFTIERAPKSGDDESSEELLLCYYKLASAEKEQRCGWLFLNDITSLCQDLPNRWITIEHPTRVIRIQSPTPAQHRVWFYTLSKCCKNAKKNPSSPPSSSVTEDRRPSLPYFSEVATQKARRNSLKYAEEPVAGTPKDELEFLREITGGTTAEVEEVRQNMDLFRGASFSTYAEDVGMLDGNFDTVNHRGGTKNEETAFKTYSPSDSSDRSEKSGASLDLDQIVRLSSAMKSTTLSPELAKPTEDKGSREIEATEATCVRGVDGARFIHASSAGPDLQELKTEQPNKGESRPLGLVKKQIHSSKSSERIAKSSTYRVHFGNEDDDKILPDDDFLYNDWDA